MRFLTTTQKTWFLRKKIQVGDFYSFPTLGFTAYPEPRYSSGVHIETNPWTQSLVGQYFLVKEIKDGFCRGNFYDRPKGPDIYLTESELGSRSLVEIIFLFLLTSIPLAIYNRFRGGVEKIEQYQK